MSFLDAAPLSQSEAEAALGSYVPSAVLIPDDLPGLELVANNSARLARALDEAAHDLSRVEVEWEGSAADAFRASLAKQPRALRLASEALAAIQKVLHNHIDMVEACRNKARIAEETYAQFLRQKAMPPPNLVTPLAVSPAVDAIRVEAISILQAAHNDYIDSAQRTAAMLRKVGAEAPGTAQSPNLLALLAPTAEPGQITDGFEAMTPAQRAAYVAQLTPAERAALIARDPRGIGNLNGIPLDMRAAANKAVALQDLVAAEASGNSEEVAMLRSLLGLDGHDQQVAGGTELLLYDPAHHHYASAIGDITIARHVAIFVPGVHPDSIEASVRGDMIDAHTIRRAAGPGTAVIAWKGYDNPGDGGLVDLSQAMLTDRARSGGGLLAGFVNDGLPRIAGQTTTVVAHSYGTLVTGEALAHDGLHPTNVVVAGSPGMDVNNVADLHLRKDQFFSERAPGDYVANGLGGYVKDPTAPDFGGTRLATNADGYNPVSGHTAYISANSKSVAVIGDVINGNVQPSDIQSQSAGDYAHAGVRNSLSVLRGTHGLDYVAQHYRGPGSSLVQGFDHIDNGLQNAVGSAVGFSVDTTVDGVKGVIHFFTN